jgi:hypothetical protein
MPQTAAKLPGRIVGDALSLIRTVSPQLGLVMLHALLFVDWQPRRAVRVGYAGHMPVRLLCSGVGMRGWSVRSVYPNASGISCGVASLDEAAIR